MQAGTSPGEFQSATWLPVLSNAYFGPGTVFGVQVVGGESLSYGSSIPDGTSGTAGMGLLELVPAR